jgi:hypothetical protein
MGQEGIPMSIVVLFLGVMLGVMSIVGVIIAVLLIAKPV